MANKYFFSDSASVKVASVLDIYFDDLLKSADAKEAKIKRVTKKVASLLQQSKKNNTQSNSK
jgi:hypothetical protein